MRQLQNTAQKWYPQNFDCIMVRDEDGNACCRLDSCKSAAMQQGQHSRCLDVDGCVHGTSKLGMFRSGHAALLDADLSVSTDQSVCT